MNKICVYTCITGSYDNLKDVKKEKGIDYICFTNNTKIKSHTWDVRYLNENLDNLTLARKVKILTHEYLLDNYDITIWVDGAMQIVGSMYDFLNNCCMIEDYDFCYIKHPERNSIYEEINECVRIQRETIKNGLKVEKFLKSQGYPLNDGLAATTILVRKNNSKIKKLMESWFYMIENYSRRDQLSINYCIWKQKNLKINVLDIPLIENQYFRHDGHLDDINNSLKRYFIDRRCDNEKFNFHNASEGNYILNDLNKGLIIDFDKDYNKFSLLLDEEGSFLKSLTVDMECNWKPINTCKIDNTDYFYGKSIIEFEGNFKKNRKILVKIELLRTRVEYRNLELNELSKKLELVESELKIEKKKISDIYNSKSWKITQFLRKILGKANK